MRGEEVGNATMPAPVMTPREESSPRPSMDDITLHFSQQEVDHFWDMFTKHDIDGSGDIDADELGGLLRACFKIAPSLALVRDILADIDADGNGVLDFEE